MRVPAVLLCVLLALVPVTVTAEEPTLVIDPQSDLSFGPFGYELLDSLQPITENLVRQMNACFERKYNGDPVRVRVLVALDENGAVTKAEPHANMPDSDASQLKAAIEGLSGCGPFVNGGRPDVYRLLDIVLIDTGS